MIKKQKTSQITHNPIGYLFILPFYIFFTLMVLWPIVTMIINSFTNYDLYRTKDFIGLENYIDLLNDKLFIQSVINTLKYSIMYIIPSMALGLLLALLLSKDTKGMKGFRTAFYIPYIISMVCASTIWMWILNPSAGVLNQILNAIGFSSKDWLRDPNLAMGCIVFISIWKSLGYCMIIFLSGIQAIPRYLYEAAGIDGANIYQKFYYITIPMLQPTTFFLFITSCIASFNVFEQVNILTDGGPLNTTTTIVHQIYTRGFTEFKMGYASAMSVVLLIFIIIITFFNFKYGNQGNDTELG